MATLAPNHIVLNIRTFFYVQDEEAAVLHTHGWLGMVLYKMLYLLVQMVLNLSPILRGGTTSGWFGTSRSTAAWRASTSPPSGCGRGTSGIPFNTMNFNS